MADPKVTDTSRIHAVPSVLYPGQDRLRPSLPVPLTRFIGREREIANVVDRLLRDDVRLLTLTGPGGVGKTRLAIRAAEEVSKDFPEGLWFVELASVRDLDLVAATIAQALDMRETTGWSAEHALRELLRARRALLILDNFEHLLDAGPLIANLLTSCPALTVMVTSRAVLNVSGEHALTVLPLAVPDQATEQFPAGSAIDLLFDSEAIRLFAERAQAASVDFALSESNVDAISEICRRLDGLPLAIELAAARVRSLPPQMMLRQMEQRLRLLTGGARDQPHRLRSMRDTIGWSYDLLTVSEQALFRRLAVFVGGWTLEAAEEVANPPGDLDCDSVDGLAALVDNSLVRQEPGLGGEPRFQMLETIREYGWEQLTTCGEAEEIKHAHAAYFLSFAERAAPELLGSKQAEWLAILEREHPNLRAALSWFAQRGDEEAFLRLAAALWNFWFVRGYYREGRSWLQQALAIPRRWSPALREALHGACMLAGNQGDLAQAAAYGDELLEISREEGDDEGVARALHLLSFAAMYQGDHVQELALAEESLALFRQLGDPHWIGIAHNRLAIACHIQGDYARAESLFEEALRIFHAQGDTWGISFVTINLGVTAQAQGDTTRAAARYRESLRRLHELGETWSDDEVLPLVAALAAVSGYREEAARLIGASERLLESIGYALPPFVHTVYERPATTLRRELGEDLFASRREEGLRLTPMQAIDEALAVVSALAESAAPRDRAATSGLTPRELDVLRLVAAGRSNREIAEALYISVPTVKRHLTNILGKLDLPSRSALNTYAHIHGLV